MQNNIEALMQNARNARARAVIVTTEMSVTWRRLPGGFHEYGEAPPLFHCEHAHAVCLVAAFIADPAIGPCFTRTFLAAMSCTDWF
jgi:hypothetical protein